MIDFISGALALCQAIQSLRTFLTSEAAAYQPGSGLFHNLLDSIKQLILQTDSVGTYIISFFYYKSISYY